MLKLNSLLWFVRSFSLSWAMLRLSYSDQCLCVVHPSVCPPVHYSPALKKWGYPGFAMSFCHSMIPWFSDCDSVTAKLECILLYNFYVCGPISVKLIQHFLFLLLILQNNVRNLFIFCINFDMDDLLLLDKNKDLGVNSCRIIIAPLWKSGNKLDLPWPSVIPWLQN